MSPCLMDELYLKSSCVSKTACVCNSTSVTNLHTALCQSTWLQSELTHTGLCCHQSSCHEGEASTFFKTQVIQGALCRLKWCETEQRVEINTGNDQGKERQTLLCHSLTFTCDLATGLQTLLTPCGLTSLKEFLSNFNKLNKQSRT